MLDQFFTRVAGRVAAFAGQPSAFIVAVGLILIWGMTGPVFRYSDTWQLVVNTATTIVTFLMVFLIQNYQNRDAAAMQAKLDEIIRSVEGARNRFIGVEHRTDSEIQAVRAELENKCGDNEANVADAVDTIERLRKRF